MQHVVLRSGGTYSSGTGEQDKQIDRRDAVLDPIGTSLAIQPGNTDWVLLEVQRLRRLREQEGRLVAQQQEAQRLRDAEAARVRRSPSAPAGGLPSPSSTNRIIATDTGNQSMDVVSDILSTVGSAAGDYFKYKYGAAALAPRTPTYVSSSPGVNVGGYRVEPDIPGIDVTKLQPEVSGMSCGTGCDSPRYMKYDCRTGELKPIKRRRRRPTLTPTQMAQLTQIGTFKNNDMVRTALAQMLK